MQGLGKGGAPSLTLIVQATAEEVDRLYYRPMGMYTPGSDGHGPRFLTGGPGAAPGGVASKNGWVYMRIQGRFDFLYLFCPSVRLSVRLSVCPSVVKRRLVRQKKCCAFAVASR